jgi:putative spermidine/putrescine transport system ATP-binding protein
MDKSEKQMTGATIRIKGLTKSFGDVTAVDNVSFEIDKGQFVTLLGPSGSGKTTILNMIAGFEELTSGDIFINDRSVGYTPPFKRDIGMVFQSYALFPHMTVGENIAFPLRNRKVSPTQIKIKVREALELVKLGGYEDRHPKQLSGGQQQRIALARAIIFSPQVLLMDEPLGALDKKLREHMQLEIKQLHKKIGITVISVTHDQGEALTMSDRVVVLNSGRIEQIGKPDELYDKPKTKFVADFIGETNFLDGTVVNREGNLLFIKTSGGLKIVAEDLDGKKEKDVSISIRPEKIIILEEGSFRDNTYSGIIEEVIYIGEITKLKVSFQGGEESVFLKLHNRKDTPNLERSSTIRIGWDRDDMTII